MEYQIATVRTEEQKSIFKDLLVRGELYTTDEVEERFRWFYEKGDGVAYLLLTEDGEAIGTKGYIMREFSVGQEKLWGAVSCDISVVPEHRTLKPAFFLHKETFKKILERVDFIYGIPNDNARPIYKRSGVMKEYAPFQRYFKPLRLESVLGKKFKILQEPLNFLWRITDSIINFTKLPAFSYEEDDMIHHHSRISYTNYQQDITIGDRSEQYMKWRYDNNPMMDYQSYGIMDEDYNTATVVYYVKNNRVYIVDFNYCISRHPKLLKKLLTKFTCHCFKQGYDGIVACMIGATEVQETLKKLWFKKFEPHKKVLWIGKNKHVSEDTLLNSDKGFWFFGDEDAN